MSGSGPNADWAEALVGDAGLPRFLDWALADEMNDAAYDAAAAWLADRRDLHLWPQPCRCLPRGGQCDYHPDCLCSDWARHEGCLRHRRPIPPSTSPGDRARIDPGARPIGARHARD